MPAPASPHVAVLLTCFNRRELTLAALRALAGANGGSCTISIVLVDDGSSDGTGDAVRAEFPEALVVAGTGGLFWNGGMRLAWQAALPLRPDYFLWLNDDTELRPMALAELLSLQVSTGDPRTIVVGCTADPATGEITYGGYRRVEGSLSRLRFRRTRLDELDCDTMNGNCVLVPASAADDIGINSAYYRHAFGDNDYGLRASKAGYRIIQLPRPVGQQQRNEAYAQAAATLTLHNWRFALRHPKGVPFREWLQFCRDHGGWVWPVNFVARYVKMAVNGIRG